ncbi:MAG: hypothetical protein SGJ07_03330 [Rhodospirillaceae bacterium]|nr:hypothetical protein [Rhodospirillaceae bacterium]
MVVDAHLQLNVFYLDLRALVRLEVTSMNFPSYAFAMTSNRHKVGMRKMRNLMPQHKIEGVNHLFGVNLRIHICLIIWIL